MSDSEGDSLVLYDADRTTYGRPNRKCGDCQLCCRLLPVRELDKPALTKCAHQCRDGCAIYESKPFTCGVYDCLWLQGDDTGPRPDRAHLVCDPMPDFVRIVENDTGKETRQSVRQVWVDPAYPNAHRAPAFLRWAERIQREEGFIVLIRYGSHKGFVMAKNADGQWREEGSGFNEPEHTAREIAEQVGGLYREATEEETAAMLNKGRK